MNPWFEVVVAGLLWGGIVAGLIVVVRDCMAERDLEATFPDHEEQGGDYCCELGSLEILPRQSQEP
jgi:hypothetical protein